MDRQDIDALLIGALYGELTPADEARLATHLDSHPGDRGALDDLKSVRQAVLDSRILAVQLEPPQALSAVLLQEAHRRAPKKVVARDEKESWFARFAKSFMAHPAMAAAAMLVLVLGGAGILYMKNGDQQFAAREASQPASEGFVADRETDRLEAAQNAPAVAMPSGASAGSAFGAGLYEESPDDTRDSKLAAEGAAADGRAVESERRKAADVTESRARGEKQKIAGGIEVTTERAPKDLDEAKNELAKDDYAGNVEQKPVAKKAAKGGTGTATGAAAAPDTSLAIGRADSSTNAVSGAGAPATGAYAQPPPPAPGATTTKTPSKPTTPPADATSITAAPKAEPAPQKAQDKNLVAWATGEHNRAITLAKAGKCAEAAKVVLAVSNRANSYYAQNMATDRRLKSCAQYINAEREREAEKSQKARAQKRVNADEAPAPTNVK